MPNKKRKKYRKKLTGKKREKRKVINHIHGSKLFSSSLLV